MGPRLTPPPAFSFSHYFLKFKLDLSLSKTVPAPLVLWKGLFNLRLQSRRGWLQKSPGSFLGLAWARRVASEGGWTENVSSQMLTPLPTAIQLHLTGPFLSGCFLCQMSSGLSSGTRNQDARGHGPAAGAVRELAGFSRPPDSAAARGLWR